MSTAMSVRPIPRRELRERDLEGIVDLHDRVYKAEYGLNDVFVAGVRRGVCAAREVGWPRTKGAVWLLDGSAGLSGALALTDEGQARGRVRWFVFAPELRGRGIGRALVAELVGEARAQAMLKLELETFSDLRAAARIYRDAGFRLIWERRLEDWGRPITYQRYELEL